MVRVVNSNNMDQVLGMVKFVNTKEYTDGICFLNELNQEIGFYNKFVDRISINSCCLSSNQLNYIDILIKAYKEKENNNIYTTHTTTNNNEA